MAPTKNPTFVMPTAAGHQDDRTAATTTSSSSGSSRTEEQPSLRSLLCHGARYNSDQQHGRSMEVGHPRRNVVTSLSSLGLGGERRSTLEILDMAIALEGGPIASCAPRTLPSSNGASWGAATGAGSARRNTWPSQ